LVYPVPSLDAGVFLEQLLKCHGNSYAAIVGDELAEADFTALRKWPTAVIGTFDRLLGLMEHGYLNLSQLVYLAIDDLDTCLQDVTFNSFLQFLHENLPECQSSRIPAVVRMGRIPKDSTTFEEVWHRLSAAEFDQLPHWFAEHGLPNNYLKGKVLMCGETPDGVEKIYRLFDDYLKTNGCSDIDKYIRLAHHHQTEAERRITLEQLRKDDFCMLITTYKFARAVHIPNVNTAINIHPAKDLDVYRKIWASLAAYVAQPSNAAGQSSRVARLINGVARIAGNVADNNKKKEGALSREVYTTLLEAGRKATPKTSTKRKATTNQASESAKRKKTQPIQPTAHQHSAESTPAENAAVDAEEDGLAPEYRSSPTTPQSSKKSRKSMDLSPSKDGLELQAVWAAIIENNLSTRWWKQYTAISIPSRSMPYVGNSKSSVYTLEMRFERVLSLSKAAALQTTELLLEYKNIADDFVRLEQQTQDPSTELGEEWVKRETNAKKETTDQARLKVVM
ncbi:hypothetical protein KCU74_g8433, partial [Aureobasidium melanogenum]